MCYIPGYILFYVYIITMVDSDVVIKVSSVQGPSDSRISRRVRVECQYTPVLGFP